MTIASPPPFPPARPTVCSAYLGRAAFAGRRLQNNGYSLPPIGYGVYGKSYTASEPGLVKNVGRIFENVKIHAYSQCEVRRNIPFGSCIRRYLTVGLSSILRHGCSLTRSRVFMPISHAPCNTVLPPAPLEAWYDDLSSQNTAVHRTHTNTDTLYSQWDMGFPGVGRFHSPDITLPISTWAGYGADIADTITLNLNFEAEVLNSPNRRY